ncbi:MULTISPECIES: DUF58 domain-containing protein [Mesorhizobium]|uniref:DUF58 domain-containing protein n=1 Tax=Mesorhizobium TaxID=68287 RepID=UPI0004809DF8|nr:MULTISPECIES: DUF58 domain-containing protein [Mesorhizobium]MCF6116973.1 DUF58 domain-containing protein [Mesorhizobium muleiense]RWB00324.1 MAG: DUF58 domain-containing protein [Mesorhizobium sp.]RWC02181.1 MAG: DUF58 domain-containing protein [Mesorhizobium sp.]RWP21483.1 MAG: DUF58 domain-containing protein [Mesorhizobium sp.]RWP99288.1 MAG: DUF58 domain-containing protein [Mesorhizobium sp.]
MIYPSGRAVWAAAAGAVPAFLVALALPSLWYLGLLWICLLLAFLAVDAAAGRGRKSLAASLHAPPQVGVGGQFTVHVAARLSGRTPTLEARVGHDERLAPIGGTGGPLAATKDGGSLDLRFQALRRGIASFDRLWLRWRGPFGLVWNQVVLPMESKVAVLPDVRSARDQAITLLQRNALPDGHAQRRAGQGREFEALKDYQPGMGRRMIDWKRSARHGRLLAREFRIEENNNIVLAIDSGRLMCEPVDGLPKVDRAVAAALLSAFIALKGGDMVSLFSFDARPRVASGAVRGSASFAMIQKRAVEIDYSNEETNFTLALTTLAARLDRRSLVIIFTDFVDPISAELMLRTVGRLTERHLVLFMMIRDVELESLADMPPSSGEDIARAVVAGGLLRERQVVIGRLRLLGAHVIEADHQRLGPALVERYLQFKREDLL